MVNENGPSRTLSLINFPDHGDLLAPPKNENANRNWIQAFVEGYINPKLSSCYSARKGVILHLLTGRNKVIQRVKRMIISPRGVWGVAGSTPQERKKESLQLLRHNEVHGRKFMNKNSLVALVAAACIASSIQFGYVYIICSTCTSYHPYLLALY